MRRILLLAAAGAIAFVGFVQLAPAEPDPPSFGSPDTEDPAAGGAVASPSAWYCPWVEAGDIVDSDVIVATEPSVEVDLTLLHPIANEVPGELAFDVAGPGATAVATGSVLRVGESPAILEISNGPAAAASMQYAEKFISADQCIVSVPKIWYLPGGSTRIGTITELRLFNPFADTAEVTVTAYSEFGIELPADLDGLDVAGRTWTTIDLEPFLPLRDELVFAVSTTQGLVIPALVRTDDRGEGMWPGTRPAETWDFPIVTVGELEPFLSVMSAGDDAVELSVDVITPGGAVRNARQVTLESAVPVRIPLSDLAAPPFGVRLRATAPVAATAVALVPESDGSGEGSLEATTTTVAEERAGEIDTPFIAGLAGTNGLVRPSRSWIVPLDTLPNAETSMWLMNTGTEQATVSYAPLGDLEPVPADPIVVPAESIVEVPVEVGIGFYGYRIEADRPITVAWTIHGEPGAALVAGIASE